jgi:hypothetical protein
VRVSGFVFRGLSTVLISLSLGPRVLAQGTSNNDSKGPDRVPAVEGIFNAFQSFPLVGIEDWHGLAQEEDFYIQLLKNPRFAEEIGNVVVEFGGAAQQATINRYVAGENVPYERLRAVWTDTLGWLPTVTSVGYLNVFAEIRVLNSSRPASERIHVWLGEPPVDWSKIKSPEDLPQFTERDRHPAELIKSEILAKHRRALVIYGGIHFRAIDKMRSLVESAYPKSFFVVEPYHDYSQASDSAALEQSIHPQNYPVLLVGQIPTDGADALLYLGPVSGLSESPQSPDLYLDENFRREIDRRSVILSGSPLSEGIPLVSPKYLSK